MLGQQDLPLHSKRKMMMNKDLRFPTDRYFYDTCSLIVAGESLFETNEPFLISSITLKELERIKTASNKDIDVKYSARLLLHNFEQYPDKYEVIPHKVDYEKRITNMGFDLTDDTRILSDALHCDEQDDIVFVTNDLSLKHIAGCFFGDGMIESIPEEIDNYTGYIEVTLTNEELVEFYQNPNDNPFGLLPGQYIIIKSSENEIIDLRVWDGVEYSYLASKPINSKWFGKIAPYEGDIYQKMLFDSLRNNKLTLVKGPAGSGKTYISLAYLMAKLEAHELDKIIVFCNTIATANSARLGYYPGTKDEKLLDSQIGNLLSSKFGGREGVEKLIAEGKLVLLPFSDIRGYDTSGMKAGIYISEAQNLDRTLMKLALQRAGEDCICIIDGDEKTQVDDIHFSGANNGMRRVSKVFRGKDIYGEVALRNIYRSKIASIADAI